MDQLVYASLFPTPTFIIIGVKRASCGMYDAEIIIGGGV